MPHLHSIYDTDLHFIIDPIKRSITSESGKVSLMQYDHNSERFTFEVPRFIEGHDMSLTNVMEIHYINADAANKQTMNKDVYFVDDLQVSPDSEDVVIGSWLISKNATTYAGSLSFIVRFVCYSEEAIEYQWFSDVFDKIKIVKGIYNSEVLPKDYDVDTLECWKRDIIQAFTESDVYKQTETFRDAAEHSANAAGEYVEEAREIVDELVKTTMPVPKGDYSSNETYEMLNLVSHNNKLWVCKKNGVQGVEPSADNADTWQLSIELIPITIDEIDAMDPIESTEIVSSRITEEELAGLLT